MEGSLLFSVFIFLAAASLVVPISKLSGLGSVMGYLIAGVLIGPSVLGFISEPDTILHFSEFGVVMMLFLIGLELQPKQLWAMRGRLIGLGGLQVGLTLAGVSAACLYLMGRPVPESIVIGMALALSSTAIVLRILEDRNLLKSDTGQNAFSILLFQDVIVIAMIASLPFLVYLGPIETVTSDALSHGPEGAPHRPSGPWFAVSVLGVFGGMILAGRLLLRPIFRLIARSRVRETFTAMALLLVVGAALLMEWLGLSPALGAFSAGVVLADSEYRHQLERDIEPFKALLLGLFFMSVGMTLNIGLIADNPIGIFALVLGLVALKFMVLFIIGTVYKLPISDRVFMAFLLCQAGEFGFVLFQFAQIEGVIAAESVGQLNTVVALSMALTPLFILAFDRWISPALAGEKRTGETPDHPHKRVLVLGFGRVGQIATRLLHTQDVETTLIDLDGDHIEFVRQFGERVFYGDASDVDLLHQAGAAEADVILIAIDDTDKATLAAREIRQHFPQAKIVARARNRTHMFDLKAEQVDFAERETVRGALALGRSVLEFLGESPDRARQLSDDFLKFDHQLIDETWQHRDDLDTLRQKAADGREFIKRTLNADRDRKTTE